VFNEACGFSGDYPHVAHMERHLKSLDRLETFKEVFQAQTGKSWISQSDAYDFHHDAIIAALSAALDQTPEASRQWLDNAEEKFTLSPENFARWVKEYLDSCGPKHRLVFFADEIGQFIGTDTQLMLNLQSITEELGTQCKGRAWVVVTSQEDMGKVLGEINASQSNDFSKITARFATRLSLSSVHADEVIRARLLAKTDEANQELNTLFASKGDVLKSQTVFTNVQLKFKKLDGPEIFQSSYPFMPYQFLLIQRVFDEIRKHGATGRHLSSGERSLLDAFRDATLKAAPKEIGALVPLYDFYPSIESFLDTAVRRTIDGANDGNLPKFDIEVLRVLFLVRYVEEFRANLDNLTTLCTNVIDVDRIALRVKIEESLVRLESSTLIRRNGDDYFFLNNEERDIDREIKDVEISAAEQSKKLGSLIFESVLKDYSKHRYPINRKDFGFDRYCDGHTVGKAMSSNELRVDIISPLSDNYEQYNASYCIMQSADRLLIKLGNDRLLYREIELWLKTDKYIKRKNDASAPHTTKRILSDRAEDNRIRENRLVALVAEQVASGEFYAAGQARAVNNGSAAVVVSTLLTYLIDNTFPKLGYLKALKESDDQCRAEINAVLKADDVGQQTMELTAANANAQAYDDLRNYIKLMTGSKHFIVLKDLIERYEKRPYGWSEFETALVVARLFIVGEISIISQRDTVDRKGAYELLTKPSKWGAVTIIQRKLVDVASLESARQLYFELFSVTGPDTEEALVESWKVQLSVWRSKLENYQTLAETGRYPGNLDIDECLGTIKSTLPEQSSYKFINNVLLHKDDLTDLRDYYHDLAQFYEHQRSTWESLLKGLEAMSPNRSEIARDAQAAAAFTELETIRTAPQPYGMIKNVSDLLQTVSAVNNELIVKKRKNVTELVDAAARQVESELEKLAANDDLSHRSLRPLQELNILANKEARLGNLLMIANSIGETVGRSMDLIEEAAALHDLGKQSKAFQSAAVDGNAPKTAVAPARTRRTIKAATVMTKPYLETKSDVTEFVAALESQLEAAIAANERIRIE
jgi:hypothetical protein